MSKKTGKRMTNAKYFSEEKWAEVNGKNIKLMEDFLRGKRSRSEQTLKQYRNALQIFFIWVLDESDNVFFIDLKKRDILNYQNWLLDQGLSAGGVKFKKSVISSLCEYIETYYDDKYPEFKNIVKGVEAPEGERVHEKEPLTLEELDLLRKELEKREDWQKLAFLELAYSTGARRAELRQLKKEIVTYQISEKGYYKSHKVRTKGSGRQGVVRELLFSEEARQAVIKWLDARGEDPCEYIFVSNSKNAKGGVRQVHESTFNYWCSKTFTEIVGRRVHPHMLRFTRATHLVTIEKKDINSAKSLLGHKSTETTEIYVVRDETESLSDCFQ